MLFLPCILSGLACAAASFFATRAYYLRKYAERPLQVTEETACPEPDGPQPEEDTGLYTRITRSILAEKLFLDPGLGRQELVTHFGLTNRQIGALFSSAGTSLPEFIRDCRLEYARELIVNRPDLTFSEIADASGFLHATTFSVDFKHKYGLTPTQYREQNV